MNFQLFPTAEASVVSLMNSIEKVVINPLIIFIFACAVILFLYGIVKFLMFPDNEEVRKTSKNHILWGVIGMTIMVSVFFIMRIILSTLGEKNIDINSKGEITIEKVQLK